MATYNVAVSATSNSVASTEDTFITVGGPTGIGFYTKRLRVSTNTASSDSVITPRLVTFTAPAVAGGSTFTPVKVRPTSPAAVSFAYIKNGTTAFALGSVSTDFGFQTDVNGRAIWEWIPRGNEEFIDSGAQGTVALAIKVSSASVVINALMTIEE